MSVESIARARMCSSQRVTAATHSKFAMPGVVEREATLHNGNGVLSRKHDAPDGAEAN